MGIGNSSLLLRTRSCDGRHGSRPEGRTALSPTRQYSAAPARRGNRPVYGLRSAGIDNQSRPADVRSERTAAQRRESTMTDDPNDRDIEAPEADAVEQALDADPNEQGEGAVSSSIEA